DALADAVVVALHGVALADAERAHQAGAAERGQDAVRARADAGGGERDAELHRTSGHGDDLEQPPRLGGEERDARAEELVERHILLRRGALGLGVADELLDEERRAARLTRDGLGAVPRGGPALRHERERELTGALERQRPD